MPQPRILVIHRRSRYTEMISDGVQNPIAGLLKQRDPLVPHSDRGVQYLSIRYTERLAEAGIETSVGSRGNSYDNALAESVIGLYKTEVIRRARAVAPS